MSLIDLDVDQPGKVGARFVDLDAPSKTGKVADFAHGLKVGADVAAQDVRELVGRVPLVGEHIVSALDKIDELYHGKSSEALLKSDIESQTSAMSPEQQAAGQKRWDTFGEDSAWRDWRSYAGGLAQSIPEQAVMMYPAMRLAMGAKAAALAKGLTEAEATAAAVKTATVAGSVTEGALGGAQSSREVRDDILSLKEPELRDSEALKTLMAGGLGFDQARAQLADDASTKAFFLSGVATGIFGGMGDRVLAKAMTGQLAGGVAKRALKGAAAEGVLEELPQSGLQQLSQNVAMREAVPSTPLDKDVAHQALGGLALGALQGGAQTAVLGRSERITAAAVSAIASAGSADEAIAAATSAAATPVATPVATASPAEPGLTEADVTSSVVGDVALPGALQGAVPRAERAMREEPAYQQAEARKQRELDAVRQANRESGLLDVTDEDLQPVAGTKPEAPVNPQMSAAWGKVILQRMEALERAKGATNAEAVRSDAGQVREGSQEGQPGVQPGAVQGGGNLQQQAPEKPGEQPITRPDSGRNGPEIVSGLPARAPRLFVERGNQRFEVKSLQEASEKWDQFRSTTGAGASAIGEGARIVDQNGSEVARISYNGRIWPPGEWKSGMEPLYKPKAETRTPAQIAEHEAFVKKVQEEAAIDAAAHEAAISPRNALPEPSKDQILAGNAKLGHANVSGMDLSFENPAGSIREDKNNTPPKWRTEMKSHYGYVKGTVGFDKDHVDVFVKPGTPENWHGNVYVVNQNKATGHLDEHKAMIGFKSEAAARAAYLENYEKGWEKNIRSIATYPLEYFKTWAQDKTVRGPKGGEAKPVTILGRPVDKLTRKELEVSARKARTNAQRAIAQAELDRRDAEKYNRPMSDAERKRRAELKRKAAERKQIDVDRDSIVNAIIKLGGLNVKERNDIVRDKRINHGIPGVGALFTKKGLSLDDMIVSLEGYGFMSPAELADVDGGAQALRDKVEEEVNGTRKHWSIEGDGAALAQGEKDQIPAETQADMAAFAQAEAEKIGADIDLTLTPEDMADSEVRVDGYALAIGELLDRAEAIQPGIGERLAMQHDIDAAYMAAVVQFLKENERAPVRETAQDHQVGGEAQRAAEPKPAAEVALPKTGTQLPNSGTDRPALDLAATTAADLKAKAVSEAAVAKKKAEEEAAAVAKSRADAEAKAPLALTGSDRAADANPNQSGLFGAVAALRTAADALEKVAKPHAEDVTKPRQKSNTGEEIADFGEKIGGARKDVWQSFNDRMKDAQGVDISAEPLSQSWPVPNYQALLDSGADSWAVAFMHSARDAVPSKPRAAWKLRPWVENVKLLRNASIDLAKGELSVEKAKSLLADMASKSRGMSDIAGRIELYQLVGHGKSLEGIRINHGQYSVYEGEKYDPPKILWTVDKQAAATAFSNWPTHLATGTTKAEALAAFKEKYASLAINQPASKETTFEIFSKRGEDGYWVGKKIGRNPSLLEGPFNSVKDARTYKAEHQAELVAKLEKVKEIPNERRDTNEPRVGEDMREGRDVTPQMFADSFGFRGVEFGNWVEQGKRQKDLNDAFDALMDMAAILNVPPKALSLNGELGLAFGARGSGGVNPAKAHYEPGHVVINLTKKEGAGSIGHEWWHALDNYFSRMREKKADYLTEGLDVSLSARGSRYEHQGIVRKEMVDAFGQVVRSIRETALKERAAKLDAKRSKEYWTTGREMSARAFESYLISKLQDQSASNDYLANIVDEATWKAAEKLGWELEDSYPYPTAGEVPKIRAGFDHFFSTVQTRETDKGVAMFSRANRLSGRSLDKALRERGERVGSKFDAMRRISDGERIFAAHEMDEEQPIELTIDDIVAGTYTSDQMLALPPNGTAFSRFTADPSGAPLLQVDDDLSLVNPRVVNTQWSDAFGTGFAGGTFYQADIVHGNRVLGMAVLNWLDGKVRDLLYIKTLSKLRKQGIAERVVRGILQHNDGQSLRAVMVLPEAKGFWEKMGAEFVATEDGEDGILTQESYSNARAGGENQKGRGPGTGQDGRQAAVGEGAAGSGDARAYRRSEGRFNTLAVEDVRRIIAPIRKNWGNAPEIEVIASIADAPAAVQRLDAEQREGGAKGEPEGFIHDGTVYLVANGLSSEAAVVRSLFHESFGHYGLKGTLGDRIVTVLNDVLKMMPGRVKAKAEEYGLNWADQDARLIAAEEVLAELAQSRPNLSMVQRAVATIRKFLRGLGMRIGLSESDIIANFILPARQFVVEARKGGWTGSGTAFVRTGLENMNRLGLAKRRLDEMVTMYEKGTLKDETTTHLGETPWALQMVGAPGRNLYVSGAMLKKVLNQRDGKHGYQITPDMARQLAAQLMEPLFIFDSERADLRARGALVLVTELIDRTGKPIVMPVHVDVKADRLVANEIASIYGREDGMNQLEKWAKDGLLRYYDKGKTANPSTTLRLSPGDPGRVPHVVQLGLAANPNVRSDEDLVKARGAMFSRAPAIAGSQTTGDHRDSLFANSATFVQDFLRSDTKFNWWNRTIGTQHHKALTNAEFKPVYDESQAFLADVSKYANESADLAKDLLPRIEGFKDFTKSSPSNADLEATTKALYAGTLWGGGSPMEGRVWTDDELSTGRARDGSLTLRVFEPLNDKQIALYRQAIASVAQSLDGLGKSLIHRLARAHDIGFDREMSMEDVVATVKDRADEGIADLNLQGEVAEGAGVEKIDAGIKELETLKRQVDDIANKTETLKAKGYFPAMRFGKYAIHVVRPGRNGQREQLYFGLFETQTAANIAARDLAQEHPDATIERGIISKEQHRLFQGMSLDALETFADYIAGENGEPIAKDPLVQGFLKAAVAERSSLKRHIHRKGLAGYSDDLPRVLASFTVSTSRTTSSNYHSAEMLRRTNDIKAGDVKDEAIKLVRYLQDPQEEAQAIRGFLFAQFLGGSIAHGLVNMTQPFMVTIPYLSQYTSAADAAAKVTKAAAERPANLTGRLRGAYERAKKEGVVAPQEIHQLRAETGGLPLAKNLALRKLSFLWGSIYAVTEQFNRSSAFIAAYRIAEEKDMADPYTFAANAVNETQFVYNKGNRPNWARGPVGATVFTFKQFSISYLELAKRIYGKDKVAFALMALMLLAAAGIEGLPFAEDIEDMIDTVGQWMGFATNSKKKLRKWATDILGADLAQAALHGVSGLPWMPVDVSVRMGLQNLIPGTSMLKLSEKNKAKDVLELAGPIGQFVPTEDTMLGKALDRIAAGDMWGVAKSGALTIAGGNVAKGAEMFSTGKAKDSKGKNIIDVTPGEAVFKMAGLQPASVQRASRVVGEVMQDISLQKRIESDIAEQWARGKADNDSEAVRAAMKQLHDWNVDNPESRIRITGEQIRSRLKQMRMSRDERIVKGAAPEVRGGVRDALRQ